MTLLFKISTYLIPVTDDLEVTPKDRSKTIKTLIVIKTKSNGCPKLPELIPHQKYHVKVLQTAVRDYCIAHIGKHPCYDICSFVTQAY